MQFFQKWLKPGGRFFIAAYATGEDPLSDEFRKYLEECQYPLWPIKKWQMTAEDVGFCDVSVQDITGDLKKSIEREIERMEKNRAEFVLVNKKCYTYRDKQACENTCAGESFREGR